MNNLKREHYVQSLRLPFKRNFLTEKKPLRSPFGGASEPLARDMVLFLILVLFGRGTRGKPKPSHPSHRNGPQRLSGKDGMPSLASNRASNCGRPLVIEYKRDSKSTRRRTGGRTYSSKSGLQTFSVVGPTGRTVLFTRPSTGFWAPRSSTNSWPAIMTP